MEMPYTMIATKKNMRRAAVLLDGKPERDRLIAYSPTTGESGSANVDDYWDMPDDDHIYLIDGDGRPMILGLYVDGIHFEALPDLRQEKEEA